MTSLDGINGGSIQMLLRGENNSKQSDDFRLATSTIEWLLEVPYLPPFPGSLGDYILDQPPK